MALTIEQIPEALERVAEENDWIDDHGQLRCNCCDTEGVAHDPDCLVVLARMAADELRGTYCAYCDKRFEITDPEEAKRAVGEHIYTCEKHPIKPMVDALREIAGAGGGNSLYTSWGEATDVADIARAALPA